MMKKIFVLYLIVSTLIFIDYSFGIIIPTQFEGLVFPNIENSNDIRYTQHFIRMFIYTPLYAVFHFNIFIFILNLHKNFIQNTHLINVIGSILFAIRFVALIVFQLNGLLLTVLDVSTIIFMLGYVLYLILSSSSVKKITYSV